MLGSLGSRIAPGSLKRVALLAERFRLSRITPFVYVVVLSNIFVLAGAITMAASAVLAISIPVVLGAFDLTEGLVGAVPLSLGFWFLAAAALSGEVAGDNASWALCLFIVAPLALAAVGCNQGFANARMANWLGGSWR